MTEYAIRVGGHLSDELTSAFPTLIADRRLGNTLLRGVLPDQAALLGVLLHLDELGVEIAEVMRFPGASNVDA